MYLVKVLYQLYLSVYQWLYRYIDFLVLFHSIPVPFPSHSCGFQSHSCRFLWIPEDSCRNGRGSVEYCDYVEKRDEKQTQKWDGKGLENISFSKMVDISVFDVFPFFIHFLCSSCQRALSILFIVTTYGNHLMLITVHTTEWEKKCFWWTEDQLVKTQKIFETDRQCWGNDKIKWGLQ